MRHHALKTVQSCTYIRNCHSGRHVLCMSGPVFIDRNTLFLSYAGEEDSRAFMHPWEGHRRTLTDSGGVTCTLGKRTVGQTAGPESEGWAPGWGQGGDTGCTDGKGWGHKHACPSRKRFQGRAMRIPGMRGVGRDVMCKPGGRPEGAIPHARGQGSLPYRCNPSGPAR